MTLEDAVSLALERIASGASKKDAVREVSRETGFPKMRSMTPSCVCRTQIELSIERSTAMATSPDYITYVCDQLAGFQPLRYRKMFGEYMVYLSDRPILTVCDNTVYVKMYPELAQLLDSAPCAAPYEGAKPHYILDIENRPLLERLIPLLAELTPLPKRKKA